MFYTKFIRKGLAELLILEMGCLRRSAVSFLICFCLLLTGKRVGGFSKVRGVNLGGWLVVEGWIKPSLFDGIPNGDLLDGTQVQLQSTFLQRYVSAANGGGGNVTVDRDVASSWETFRLWRVSDTTFMFRCLGGQFLSSSAQSNSILATSESPDLTETFSIERNQTRVHLKLASGSYVQATTQYQLTSDYQGQPGWDDNAATFDLIIAANPLHGDYQLANGYGHDKATEVYMDHWNMFITESDFGFLSRHGINSVRIPVGWWIAHDPTPPSPFIGGSLAALDKAFSWAKTYNLRCIIDLHAAPGSQNGMEHSASRDGSADWASNSEYISQSLQTIEFLMSRYANHPALLGIELLNEPSVSTVPLEILVSYYMKGYQIVRKYSTTAYVIVCQRIGSADPLELYQADIGSSKLVVDLHYYNLFDAYFDNMSIVDNILFIFKNREAQVQQLNSENGPLLFIGEWVNEWNRTKGIQSEYQNYGRAQLQVYDAASFGWCYWTIKCAEVHWDFEWNIRNNYLLYSATFSKQISWLVLYLEMASVYFFLQEFI